AAGTLVVKEDLTARPITTTPSRAPRDGQPLAIAARLSDNEYAVLDRFIQRRMDFEPARRTALADALTRQLRASLGDSFTDGASTSIAALVQLHDEEQAARARGVAGRDHAGASRERHAIVAINAPRWSAFADRLKRIQSAGLRAQNEVVVREFVQEYRELTSDLARLRTASRGTDSPELFYLNRLVASAHSLLYRRRTLRLRSAVHYLFVAVPAEIRASVRPIALAAALLFVPMIVTARAVVEKPALATTLLSPGMIARADSGVVKAKAGRGYIEDPQMLRPLFASQLVTNNVQVAFMAFASGMTAGLMTVWVLLSNGVSIGAAIGLYFSKGIGHLIMGFIAAHGVFELSAIAIAGGAGMLLAAGILIPGERTRAVALAANGRRAIRLVGGCCLLLVLAAFIEGFISPNASISAGAKYAISALTACALVLYLFPWRTAVATARRDSSAPDTDSRLGPSLSLVTHPTQ
ncbi:MAG: stage II sporulation protein M, partial [Gemmatimonadaceae bacterium]|nr:stage II sporulation protein M [Gemmatimonadaceae bacterium]